MADVLELKKSLKTVAEREREAFQANEQRQFFIELFPGADTLETLLKAFDPDTHNGEAQSEFQKLKKSMADIDKYIKDRRAVAFMYSGKQCMRKHYEETELTCHVMGVPRMNWVINELEQLQRTQIKDKSIFTAKKG